MRIRRLEVKNQKNVNMSGSNKKILKRDVRKAVHDF